MQGRGTRIRDESGLRRQWVLLRALSSRHSGLTIRQMADELGVTDRTIRRDLDVFRGVGLPLDETTGDYGRKTWRIKGARDLPPLGFTLDEAIALYLGRRQLGPLDGTPFGEVSRLAYGKLRATFSAVALAYIERFSAFFHETGVGPRNYAAKSEILDGLRVAIEDGRAARLLYRSGGAAEATGRDVHPYGMILHRGALYLVALDPGPGRIKHYKLDRIEDAEVGLAAPRPPEGFDLDAYMDPAFAAYREDAEPTEVVVRFGPSAARYVQESKRHSSQRVTRQPDGAILARYRVSGTEEIKSWILGFGSKAVVLGPESLRLEIARELRELARAYETPSAAPAPPAGREGSPPGDRRPRAGHDMNRER